MISSCYGGLASLQYPRTQEPSAPDICISPYYDNQIGIRHNEAQGVGYKQGYTTVEAFFLSKYFGNDFLPFIDLRGHVFNNGKFAGNIGIGSRSLLSQINHYLGAYLYYDVRSENRLTINQIGPGLELVGKRMEYRLNGYFPVGKKTSRYYGLKFHEFKGYSMFVERTQKRALSAIDGEVGVHFVQSTTDYDLFGGISPYYLWGSDDSAWGGKARLTGSYKQYITLELSGSYDSIFKGTVQGSIALRVPFGAKLSRKGPCLPKPNQDLLQTRAVQSPYRFEIPMIKKHKSHQLAINPLTGNPYTFWFVDNTSHSLGTFESPFSTLSDAETASSPGDVIYIFSGDGTSTGMSNGIVLQDNQKLFGAGIAQTLQTTLGDVVIPQMSPSFPAITASANAVVSLASGNEVSGLQILGSMTTDEDILGNVINGAYIHDNILGGFDNFDSFGSITIIGNGLLIVTNNQISTTAPVTFEAIRIVTAPGAFITGTISYNIISGPYQTGIAINANNGGSYNLDIMRNMIRINGGTGDGIFLGTSAGPPGFSQANVSFNTIDSLDSSTRGILTATDNACLMIEGNQISNVTGGVGIGIIGQGAISPPTQVTVKNNVVTNVLGGFSGIRAVTNAGGTLCLNLIDNTSLVPVGYEVAPSGSAGIIQLAPAEGNVGTFAPTVGTVIFVPAGSCDCTP